MLSFNHSGNLGDICFSLHFCKDAIETRGEKQFDFNIQIGVPSKYHDPHPYGNIRMTKKSAEMLKPLLEHQVYVNNVSISEIVPEKSFNLDNFRILKLNLNGGDIRSWYYALAKSHFARKFEEKILFSPIDKIYEDKIIVINTQRYQNTYIDYKLLKPFEEHFVFCGTKEEHEIFERKSGVICEYRPINDFLEFASIVEGSKGVLGNQSGLYSICECLKCPRILVSAEFISRGVRGPTNVHPIGGWNEVASTNVKLVSSVENLLEL